MELKLHGYWRSTAAYRVRIALNIKGLAYDQQPVNLLTSEQHKAAYREINPQRMVPALEVDGQIMTQSLAILEWLEEMHPEPALLPKGPWDRAVVRNMCEVVACDIHPLNNPRVMRALTAMEAPEEARKTWMSRWMTDGFQVLETMVAKHGGGWAFGDQPTMADCCLIPQIYSANRFHVDLTPFPAIRAVAERAAQHPAFAAADPAVQPDAVV